MSSNSELSYLHCKTFKISKYYLLCFSLFQLSLAARLPRETVETSTQSLSSQVEDGFAKLQNEFKATFTKENFDV